MTQLGLGSSLREANVHLELIHDFADGFAAGADDAGVNAVVQRDVLRNHLFKFTHNFQNGVPGRFRVLFIPCDRNLVLGLAPIVLIGKLDVHVMLQADLCNHRPFSPNNFGMVFGSTVRSV